MIEKNDWVFARKGDGYLALRSQRPYYWKTGNPSDYHTDLIANAPEDVNREIVVPGESNIWICEMGRRTTDGEFADFVRSISTTDLQFDGVNVSYESPSQGRLEFGWKRPFTQDGRPIDVHNYPRYDNPYVHAEFAPNEINIHCGEERLSLNWEREERAIL